MSSILKALKKLEEEKKSSTERMDQVSRYDAPATPFARRPRSTPLLLVCGMLIALFAAGGWMLWSGPGTTGGSSGQTALAPNPDQIGEQQATAPQQGNASASPELAQPAIPAQTIPMPTEVTTTEAADTAGAAEQTIAQTFASSRELPAAKTVGDSALSKAGEGGRDKAEAPASSPDGPSDTTEAVVEIAMPAVAPAPAAAVESPAAGNPASQVPGTSAQVELQAVEVGADMSDASGGVRSSRISNTPAKPPVAVLQDEPAKSEAPGVATAPAPFQVTEIFYQPNEGSMAVVDDLPVMEGTVVNGVLIDKILPDRVRFIVDGMPVEVSVREAKP